jgi:hypothetical protein
LARIKGEYDNLKRDRQLHPEDPYQSELYELLIEPCKQLLEAAQHVAEGPSEDEEAAPID